VPCYRVARTRLILERVKCDRVLEVVRATKHDFDTVIGLIEEAARWLRTKGTDQWAEPWPSRRGRNDRVMESLKSGKTWLAFDGAGTPAATITIEETANPEVWTEWEAGERAVYVQRLVVSRRYASMKLGAALLNWAGQRAAVRYGAKLMRIDVWTTNKALHRYYERQGFTRVGNCADETYPSGARFERKTDCAGDGGEVELTVGDAGMAPSGYDGNGGPAPA
jgi:GNAT superfamily N-acetyltransferase